MSKKNWALMLVLSCSLQATLPFSFEGISKIPTEQILSQENKALLYLSCGYANLNSKNYRDAIEDYQKVSDLLVDLNNPGIDFLNSFGMIVACDHLCLSGSIQLHASHIEYLINNDFQNAESARDVIIQGDSEVVDQLIACADEVNSEETQQLLRFFISKIFSLDSISVKQARLFALDITSSCPAKSGSFWKKTERLARRISRTWDKIYKIYKQMREVEEDFKSRFGKEE